MTPTLHEQQTNFFGALSDPTRHAIFRLVLVRPMAVKVIAAEMPVSQPAVSQHLQVLKASGLVTEQRQGRFRVYAANPAALDRLALQLSTLRDEVLAQRSAAAQSREDDFDAVDRAMDRWSCQWPGLDGLSTGLHLRLRVIASLLETLSEKNAARAQLSVPELGVLGTLDRLAASEIKLSELTEGRLMHQATEPDHLHRLEARGFIALRSETPSSGVWSVSLTPAGREALHRIMDEQQTMELAALCTMARDDQLRLVTLLRSLLRKLRTTLDSLGS
jgi:DNA-binding transcriptional ArsR family regulator